MAMIDSSVTSGSLGWRFALRGYKRWARRNLEFTLRHGPGYFWRKLKVKLGCHRPDRFSATEALPADTGGVDQMNTFVRVNLIRKIWRNAQRDYYPQPIACRGVLFLSEDVLDCTADPSLGANAVFAGGVEIVAVPGDHTTVIQEPHVQSLAAEFGRFLDRLE